MSPPPPAPTRLSIVLPGDTPKTALTLAAVLLVLLTLSKSIPASGLLAQLLATALAAYQLFVPVWRLDHFGDGLKLCGLHWGNWQQDLRLCLWLCLITFPPYIAIHHIFMCHGQSLATAMGISDSLPALSAHALSWSLPADLSAVWDSLVFVASLTFTHLLGVALPEETFYRGYLLPTLRGEKTGDSSSSPVALLTSSPVLISCGLFALGHFLGEWNPLRLGPFFPALLFSYLRLRTGSILGAICYHAACNVLGAVIHTWYVPV